MLMVYVSFSGQQNTSSVLSQDDRNNSPPLAPPGTVSVAHRLLSPKVSYSTAPDAGSSTINTKYNQAQQPIPGRTHGHPHPAPPPTPHLAPLDKVQSSPNIGVEFVSDGADAASPGRKRTMAQSVGGGVDYSHTHRDLIESMYGVERRGPHNQPYKRVKSAETLGQDRANMNAHFAAGNSGLGRWIKNTQASYGDPTKVVDLTTGSKGLCVWFYAYSKVLYC